jgi:hypothetical protein
VSLVRSLATERVPFELRRGIRRGGRLRRCWAYCTDTTGRWGWSSVSAIGCREWLPDARRLLALQNLQ